MQARIRNHIRSNVVGYVAVFIALTGGTAIAAGQKAPKNSVVSKSIKNGAVKGMDVKSSQVQLRVGGSCPAGEAIRVINVDGGVLCEVDNEGAAGGPPSGPAGGSLAGAYPNPTLAPDSVGRGELADDAVNSAEVADGSLTGADVGDGLLSGADVANNSLTGVDVQESSLAQVPSALIGGFGRGGNEGSCDPESATFVTCAVVNLTVPTGGARAFLVGRIHGLAEGGADTGKGLCRLGTSTVGVVPQSTVFVDAHRAEILPTPAMATLIGVTPPLPAGANSFGIDCNQDPTQGAVQFREAAVSAVLIAPD